MPRTCIQCGNRLPHRMRSDARYCSDHCRYVAHGKMRGLAEQPEARHRAKDRPNWLRLFEQRLILHAPAEAVAYRLALTSGSQVWYYPPADRPSLRWDGRRRLDGAFSLVPFEPPIVPRADLYGILFYDGRGAELRTPPALAAGVDVYALPARRIELFDGEREE